MTLKEIKDTAAQLVEDKRVKQKEIAEALGIAQGNVSSALNKVGSRWVGIQTKIIELYSDYTIKRRIEYVVERKPSEGDE